MLFVAERLTTSHAVDGFSSGTPALDLWLREHALDADQRRTARTFVWHPGDHAVVGYYALTAHVLEREAIPRSIGHGAPRQIPAVLLARLAFDRSLHGQGLGGALLAEALQRVVAATETVAARFVIVDAIDRRAAAFYAHYGFRPIPGSLRLVQKVSDISAALDA